MRKLFSISKKQTTILITLVVLSLAVVWYYFDYIPKNEQALEEQHFRWLQKADENVRVKILGFDTLLANLLNAYVDNDPDSVEKYIKGYTVPDATLSAYKSSLDSGKQKKTFVQDHNQTKADTNSILFILRWDSLSNKLTFAATKKIPEKDSQYTVVMTSDFGKFISPLLTTDLFEHYVIFYNGKYIYEDFHSGLGYDIKNEDSLLTTGKNMTGANIIKQKVGGVDYQIFLQPINFFSNGRLIIAGLLSQKTIDAEKKQLPAGVIILAIIIALGILLFLPWIKIYFQGKYDKIDMKDAAASAVVAKLLISLVVLLCFTYNNPFKPDIEEDSKNFLADTIASSFTREIDAAFMCLQNFDTVACSHKMFYDVKNLGKNSAKYKTGENIFSGEYHDDTLGILKSLTCSINYSEVNWLDSNGFLKYGWTTANQNNIHANYNYRPYFKKIQDGNTTLLNIKPYTSFVLDQVISRTSGSFRTIISKRSCLDTLKSKNASAKVVALSFTIKSLDNVVMPAGYSFAIIDNKGNVDYHSKSERNLNENLLKEFSDSEELDDALAGRFREEFTTNYYEGTYSVLAKPMKDLPYFIVIMSDQGFPGSVQIETFSFTWGMILVFLIVVILDLFILIAASSRRSLFKKQYFVTSWIWPRKCSKNEYRIAATGNSILIVVLILIPFLFPHFYDYLSYLFVLFISIPLSTIFINSLFLYKYRKGKNKTFQNYKVNCNICSAAFLAILNVFAIILLAWSTYWHVLLFEVIMTGALYTFFSVYKKRPEPESDHQHKDRGFIKYFVRMIFTRLVITSAIPALFFYVASFNYENNLLARYRQYDFVKQLQQKFTGKPSSAISIYNNGVYPDNIWIKSVVDTVADLPQINKLTVTQINTGRLFNSFGFYLEDGVTINDDNFYKSVSDDSNLYFNNFFDSVLYTHNPNKLFVNNKIFAEPVDSLKIDSIKIADTNTVAKQVLVTSQNLNYTFPTFGLKNGFMFWLLLMLALYCFYLILREVIKKVCSLNLDSITLLKDARITTDDLIAKEDEPLLWIIGLPVDETIEQVKEKISHDDVISLLDFNNIIINNNKPKDASLPFIEEGVYVIQLKAAENKNDKWEEIKSAVKNDTRKFVLLLNIENNLADEAITQEKLKCIKELLDSGKIVRVVSSMHPLKMLEILNQKKDDNTNHLDTASARLMYLTLENAPVVILPFIKNNFENTTKTGITAVDLFLDKELQYTQFLKRLYKESLLTDKEKIITKFREDKLTLRIQFLANNFYMSIWRSLAADEKFILYDLASDGLVNITHTVAMSMLMSKGLIVEEEGNLHIFNSSFRNFILTSVDSTELAHLQMLHNKHSNWSSLQTPLLIVVLVVFVFLAIAQEGLYSRVIAIISGIAAGIPAILKILSMFGATNSKDVKNTPQE